MGGGRGQAVQFALAARARRHRNRRRYAVPPPAPRAPWRRRAAPGSGSMNMRHADAGTAPSAPTSGRNASETARHVQTAFGGPLLAPFGHDASGVRPMAQRDLHHLGGGRHLQIERQMERSSISRSMSSSEIWRRSSRKCAVMPSAPASAAICAARTGSGWRRRGHCGWWPHGRYSRRDAVCGFIDVVRRQFLARSTELMAGVARRAAMMLVRCLTSRTSISMIISKKSAVRLVIFKLVMLPQVLGDHRRQTCPGCPVR